MKYVSSSCVADRLQKQITKNAKDERYPRDANGVQYQDLEQAMLVGVTGVEKLDDEIASQLNSIMEELDELAKLYDVPKLGLLQ